MHACGRLPHFVQQPHHCFPEMLAAWMPTPRQWTSIGCSQIRPMLGLDYPRVVLACHKPWSGGCSAITSSIPCHGQQLNQQHQCCQQWIGMCHDVGTLPQVWYPHEGCHCQGQSWWDPMPKLLAPCGQLCPEVCWWLPFPIVGIPFHLWYLGYINTFFLFIPLFVQITKIYPSNFLPKQLCNQADSSMPASWWARTWWSSWPWWISSTPPRCFHMWGVPSGQHQDGYAKILTKQDLDKLRGPAHQAKPAGQIMGSGHGPPCATKHRCQGIWQNGCQNHSLSDSQAENVQGGHHLWGLDSHFGAIHQRCPRHHHHQSCGSPTRHPGDQCDWCQPTGHCFPPSWAHEDPWHAPLLNWFFCLDGTMAFSWIGPPRSLLPL